MEKPLKQYGLRRKILRTLTLLLLDAVKHPDKLKLAYSVGDGYFFHLGGDHPPLPRDVVAIKQAMLEAVKANRPIETAQMDREELVSKLTDLKRTRTLAWLQDRSEPAPTLIRRNGDVFAFDGPLLDSTGQVGPWDLVPYPPGLLLRMPPNGVQELGPHRERPGLFRAFYEGDQWGQVHGTSYVSDVNSVIRTGTLPDLIQVSEALQDRTIAKIADKILTTQPRPSVVLVSGPSSSGKTSFSMRLRTHLRLLGMVPHAIGLDNYYLPRDQVPRTSDGDYDYERLEALDIDLFNESLLRLISGDSVNLPVIDFKTHDRKEGPAVKLDGRGILIVEGIHGLNPHLTPHLTAASTFKVYVSALTHLNLDRLNRVSTTDLRLLRRMVRDRRSRGYPADDTLSRWPSVRRGELQHIFPYQEEADVMFNSALPYELNALKPLAHEAMQESADQTVQREIDRLRDILDGVQPIGVDTLNRHLPPTSILREFTGGSVLVA
ncbi:nucleoside kinase [bacterium]|nr:nucleoside kinase [bacterium]